jgi:hypothetical protein
MKEDLANLRLFFRLFVGGFIFKEEFLESAKTLPPEAVHEVLVDCKGHTAVGGACLDILEPQLIQWKVLRLLLGFVNKTGDLNLVEGKALAEILTVMEHFQETDLMMEEVVDHKRWEIRRRLVEILAIRNSILYFQRIGEVIFQKAHKDDNPDVRLAAVNGIAGRSGMHMTKKLITLLGHPDKDTRSAAYKALKIRNDRERFELTLCEAYEFEVKNGNGGNVSAGALKNLIKHGIKRWDMNTLLSVIWKGFLALNQKLEQNCREAIVLLLDGPNRAPNSHLIGAYKRSADHPEEKFLIFSALCKRAGEDIEQCMLKIARDDPDEKYWVPALGELNKRGVINAVRDDVLGEG